MSQSNPVWSTQGLPEIITPELLKHIQNTYRLRADGIHGWSHWVRVCENGLRVASLNGANTSVVALFAFTHDMDRHSDGSDHDHGPRAARRIHQELRPMPIPLSSVEWDLLEEAVAGHTRGLIEADRTVQTCWDADRLDLGRVGIRPAPHRLCTPEARSKEVLEWAFRRSQYWK